MLSYFAEGDAALAQRVSLFPAMRSGAQIRSDGTLGQGVVLQAFLSPGTETLLSWNRDTGARCDGTNITSDRRGFDNIVVVLCLL